jgi:hypothetical protein
MSLSGLLLLSVLVPAAAGTTGAPPRDYDAPPPGSPQDQELWARARRVNNQILIERGVATRLQARAKGYGYTDRLRALSRGESATAERAEELGERITRKWNEVVELLTKQWPVDPTRACRAPLLVFEGVLQLGESPGKAGQLEDARRVLQGCVAKGTIPLEILARLNRELEELLGQADRLLADARAATASAAPAAAATPAAQGK